MSSRPDTERITLQPAMAPEDVILDLARLRPLLSRWPKVLPSMDHRDVLPLKIGVHHDLLAIAVPGADAQAIRHYLGYYTISAAYRRACSVAGAARHDLDARPAGMVVSDSTRQSGGPGAPRVPTPSQDPTELLIVRTTAKAMKTTLVVAAADFANLSVPNGLSRGMIEVSLQDGRRVEAEVSARSLRKAALAVTQAGASNATVVLSGTLDKDGRLEGAGVAVSLKATVPVT